MKNYTNENYTTIRYEKLWTSSYSWKHLNINRLRFFPEVRVMHITGIHNLHLMLSGSGIFSGIRAPYFTVVYLTLMFCIHDIQSLDLSKSAILDWVSFFSSGKFWNGTFREVTTIFTFFMFCISFCLYSRRKLLIFPHTDVSINNFILPPYFQFLIHKSRHYITNAVKNVIT